MMGIDEKSPTSQPEITKPEVDYSSSDVPVVDSPDPRTLLDQAGFTPVKAGPDPVHTYNPAEAVHRPDLTIPDRMTKDLGMDPAQGSYTREKVTNAEGTTQNVEPTVKELPPLERDRWFTQYYDGSKPVGSNPGDRSLQWWKEIDPAEIPTLTEKSVVERSLEDSAVLDGWGPRTHVQVACIPAGTRISCIESEVAPKVEDPVTRLFQEPYVNPQTGEFTAKRHGADLRPELQQDQILELIADARLGGGPQTSFAQFDEGWIVGARKLPDAAMHHPHSQFGN